MKTNEANKIIAEFMGHDVYAIDVHISCRGKSRNYFFEMYSEDLNALVPVWEKLEFFDNEEFITTDNEVTIKKWHGDGEWLFMFNEIEGVGFGRTLQEAAAIATAKAIKELGK